MPHYFGDFELRPVVLVRKGPRQSRDLAEYVAIAYLNILKLEVVMELELLKVEDFQEIPWISIGWGSISIVPVQKMSSS